MAISNVTPQPDASITGGARTISGQTAGKTQGRAGNTGTANAGRNASASTVTTVQQATQAIQQNTRGLTINRSGTPSSQTPRGSIINIVV